MKLIQRQWQQHNRQKQQQQQCVCIRKATRPTHTHSIQLMLFALCALHAWRPTDVCAQTATTTTMQMPNVNDGQTMASIFTIQTPSPPATTTTTTNAITAAVMRALNETLPTSTSPTTTMEWLNNSTHGIILPIATTMALPAATTMSSNEFDIDAGAAGPAADADEMTNYKYCLANRNTIADLFTIVLYALVCIVGLFGNTLVIYVVLRYSKMQTVTNIYILNLAIADECFLIGIPFLIYTMRICSWQFGEYMCKAYMVSTSITQFTSSIFLVIMSADRYLAVCHPIASPKYRTLNIAKLVSAIAWLTSVVLMMPVILYASQVQQQDGIHLSCNIDWPEQYQTHSGTTFILYNFILGFATPLCFILIFYYLVIRKLHAVGPQHKSKKKKHTHRKVTRLVLTVITVYILCWLPHWISQVTLINSNPGQRELSRLEILIFLLFGCLQYSNSAMNPILYAFLSHNFRKSFTKAFTCMARQEVNAQLQVEPSVLTKQLSRRRAGSKRLLGMGGTTAATAAAAATPQMQQHPHGPANKHQQQKQQQQQQQTKQQQQQQFLQPPQQQQQQHCMVTLNMSKGNSCSNATSSSVGNPHDKHISGCGGSTGGSSSTSTSNCTSSGTQATTTTIVLNHDQQAVCTLQPQQHQQHHQQQQQQQQHVELLNNSHSALQTNV